MLPSFTPPIAYEEGSWTPTIAGSVAAGTQTYSGQIGRYLRIGNLVFVQGRVAMSAKDAATSGPIGIAGLPYTPRNIATLNAVASIQFSNLDIDVAGGYSQVVGRIQPNIARIELMEQGDNVVNTNLTDVDLAATTVISFSASYLIN